MCCILSYGKNVYFFVTFYHFIVVYVENETNEHVSSRNMFQNETDMFQKKVVVKLPRPFFINYIFYNTTSFPFFLKTTPFLSPVCLPFCTITSPLIITYSIPSGYWIGSVKVPLSITVSALKIQISA